MCTRQRPTQYNGISILSRMENKSVYDVEHPVENDHKNEKISKNNDSF